MSDLAGLARRWVEELPRPFITALASALRAGPASVQALAHGAAAPASQTAARGAVELAKTNDGAYLAGLLDGMAAIRHDAPEVRAVWTGPSSSAGGSRLTIAVVADLIAEAEHEILLVSYATCPLPMVTTALQNAAARGVAVTLLLERAQDKPGWKGMVEPFPALDAQQLCWPLSKRPVGASLHAKVLVVDRRVALVGSANLTAFALERNLECGLLVRGGHVPRLLAEHLTNAEGLGRAE